MKVLLHFRSKPVVLLVDIQNMFCQTEINPKDYRFQQYLWRHFDSSTEPTKYRLMFGVKSSPFLAMKSIQHHISRPDLQELFLKACEAAKSLYVDDLFNGGSAVDEVIDLVSQLMELFQLGGWRLTKFVSNSRSVMDSISKEDHLENLVVPFEDGDYGFTKALSIDWDVKGNYFNFQLNEKHLGITSVTTKRNILSKVFQVFQVFDTFGFYSPFVIRMEILLQELWQLQVSWVEVIKGEIATRFSTWEEELKTINTITIPRLVIKKNLITIELHA